MLQGVVTSILPVETFTTGIKMLFHTESSDQDIREIGDQVIFLANF